MEGIIQTILDLTRGFLADPARAPELEEILVSRDPVRLVTSRSLFSRPPLALVEMALERFGADPREALLENVFSRSRLEDARAALAALAAFVSGPGETTLGGILAAYGQSRSSVILPIPGAGLVLTAADRAAEFSCRLRDGFRQTTGGQELQTAIEPLWPDEALLGRSPDLQRPPRFGVLLDALAQRRVQALPRSSGVLPVVPGFIQRCVSCARRPAQVRDDRPGHVGDGELLCAGCRKSRDLIGGPREDSGESYDEASHEDALTPLDRADGSGHLAFVTARVDEIDPLLVELGGIDQVHLTCRAIDRALGGSIAGLVERLGLRRRFLRFPLGIGSVLLVVPASRALDTVRRLVDGAEAQLAREGEALGGFPEIQEGLARMRLRVGLCFAPVHYPTRTAVEMEFALADSARRTALRAGGDPVSTLDFWVLSDGVQFSTAVDELRHQSYEARRDVRLSRRPYTFPKFKREILDLFRSFRRLPRTEVLELRRLVLCDPRASDINFRFQLSHSEEWRLFATEAVGRDPARWESLLFRQAADGGRETSFLDLIELTEFVD